jgi:hypothetical protein
MVGVLEYMAGRGRVHYRSDSGEIVNHANVHICGRATTAQALLRPTPPEMMITRLSKSTLLLGDLLCWRSIRLGKGSGFSAFLDRNRLSTILQPVFTN